MDDLGGLLVLGFLYFLFQVLTRGGRQTQRRGPNLPRDPVRRSPVQPRTTAPAGTDPTQREGSALEVLLRDLQRSLDEAAQARAPAPPPSRTGTMDRPSQRTTTSSERVAAAPPVDDGEDVEEEVESLEVEPTIVSLETGVERPARRIVDLDDEAEEIVRRRIEAARQRDRALTRADHAAFDERIRREPADHTAVSGADRVRRLREAVVWSEILGRPKALDD